MRKISYHNMVFVIHDMHKAIIPFKVYKIID